MWHRLVASVPIPPVLHRAKLGESKAMDGLMSFVLCSLTSRRCPGHGQMGTSGKWPRLDVVWVAFETVSLLVHMGEGVCGFKIELLLNQLGSWVSPWLSGDVSVSAVRWEEASTWLPLPGTAGEFLLSSHLTKKIPPQQTEEGQELSRWVL